MPKKKTAAILAANIRAYTSKRYSSTDNFKCLPILVTCITKLTMTDVIIEVLGGVVQNVAVSQEDVRVTVVDWDNIACTAREEEKALEWMPVQDTSCLTPDTDKLYKQLLRK